MKACPRGVGQVDRDLGVWRWTWIDLTMPQGEFTAHALAALAQLGQRPIGLHAKQAVQMAHDRDTRVRRQ